LCILEIKKQKMTVQIENTIINGYLSLLSGLSDDGKKQIIKRLNKTIQVPPKPISKGFREAFGAWQSEETAQEIIETIYNARTNNPNRIEL
jgi:hypothetical protein